MTPKSVIVCFSGGLDSTVLLAVLLDEGFTPFPVSFAYGQTHIRELESARRVAGHYGLRHEVVDLSPLGKLLRSSLTGCGPIPDGHYAAPTMAQTVVPNRNAIMLSVCAGVAVAEGAGLIACAAHAGDHHIYPDCRPTFFDSFETMVRLATGVPLSILRPFVNMSKGDIVKAGGLVSAPFELTWSCYRGQESHCGVCGTCVERREAFAQAVVPDPTEYATHEGSEEK